MSVLDKLQGEESKEEPLLRKRKRANSEDCLNQRAEGDDKEVLYKRDKVRLIDPNINENNKMKLVYEDRELDITEQE